MVTAWRRWPSLAAVLLAPALLRSGLPSRYAAPAALAARRRAPRPRACAAACASSAARASASRPPSAQLARLGHPVAVLLRAAGRARARRQRADLGAAAAVLFAVNVTAVLPVTPSNLGVFQAACVAVLTGAYGVPRRRRAGLRDHPAGRRDHHRGDDGHAGAAARGPVLARRAPARPARLAGRALRPRGAAVRRALALRHDFELPAHPRVDAAEVRVLADGRSVGVEAIGFGLPPSMRS